MSKYSIDTESYINSLENNYYCVNRNGQDIQLKLDDKHKDIIDSINNFITTLIVKGRQIGSTTLLTAYVTEYCKRNPKTKVLIVGHNPQAEKDIIEKIREHSENKHKVNNKIVAASVNDIVFSNYSEVSNNLKRIKDRIDIIYVSEASFINDVIMQELHYLYDIHKPKKVIIDGTPTTNEFKIMVEKNKTDVGKSVMFINYQDTPTIHPNPQIWIKGMKLTLTKKEFDQEILGKL